MFLITGATGNVGKALVQQLLEAGQPVRAVTRASSQAALPEGATRVVGDLNHPETLVEALAGVRALFLMSGFGKLSSLLEHAKRAGVAHVVLLSSSSAPTGDMNNAVARYHILSEVAVRDSGLPWTFLQPNSFMTNVLPWASQLRAGDVVRAPFATVRVASIDTRDIAAVAAKALLTPGHAGRSYRLSGPQALLPEERVQILGRVLGRRLRFEAQSNDAARAEMLQSIPPEYVAAFFSFFVDGTLDEAPVLPAVFEITGAAPRSFEAWARDHVAAFTA